MLSWAKFNRYVYIYFLVKCILNTSISWLYIQILQLKFNLFVYVTSKYK